VFDVSRYGPGVVVWGEGVLAFRGGKLIIIRKLLTPAIQYRLYINMT